MFPLFQLKGTLRVWQLNYCQGAFESCERFQKSCTGEAVEPNLLPNGKRLVLDPGVKR